MDRRQIGERLQGLVDGVLKREKRVHNIVLGVDLRGGEYRWSGAAGMADPAAGRPMRADTPFLIASITKMYTAAAVMILAERGALSLDDRLADHLPAGAIRGLHTHGGRDHTGALTLRHLLGQTSGFRDYFLERPRGGTSLFDRLLAEGDRPWELDDVVRYTRETLPPLFPPADLAGGAGGRVRAHYSDTNYKLLGAVLEAVAGRPLPALFEELFFEPLGLTRTYLFGHPRAGAVEEPARVFHRDRPMVIDRLMGSHGPEGGIVSTLDDTLRFGRAFAAGSLFARPDTLAAMQRWNRIFFPLQYGYGLMRFKLPWILAPVGFSPELVGHSGSSGSFLYHCREIDLVIAGTINQMALQRVPFPLMIRIAKLFRKAAR